MEIKNISIRSVRSILLALLGLTAIGNFSGLARAAEGGMGVYSLGYTSVGAGISPGPATVFSYNYYNYNASATVNANIPNVPIPGTGMTGTATGKISVDIDAQAHILAASHFFETKVLGGTPGVTVTVPFINSKLNVAGQGALVSSDGSVYIPLEGKKSFDEAAMGDMIATGTLGWHDGPMHYMGILNIYLPTGSYNSKRVLNAGKNHTAVEPMLGVTYLNPKGLELSTAFGVTFNQKNTATDYKNGNEFHIDIAAIQHFNKQFYAGLTGYAYRQLTGDSGSGAKSANKGRVNAIGPVVGYTAMLGPKTPLLLNARFYIESGAERRFEGKAFYLTAAIPL